MKDIEDYNINHFLIDETEVEKRDEMSLFIVDFINILDLRSENNDTINPHKWNSILKELRQKYHYNPSIITMNYYYLKNVSEKKIKPNAIYEEHSIRKNSRINSGIQQITFMFPALVNGKPWSCEHNCYYCPNEPAHEGNNFTPQPRSYLYHEPAVARANQWDFDIKKQIWSRLTCLSLLGHFPNKLEMMGSGGTFGSYPEDFRIDVARDMYYAVNTFYEDKNNLRESLSLEEEIEINMTAKARVIGLTFETRPDHVTAREIELLRRMNCTRVQIGVQHTVDYILKKVNRGCYYEDTIRAIYNLLNVGLKVDVHLMFDLPFAEYEDDMEMVDFIYKTENGVNTFATAEFTFDQAKYYPFSSVDWTVTKTWEDNGQNLHYSHEELIDVLMYAKSMTPPTVRLNRVIRDIPSHYIHAGNDIPNLRQILEQKMKENNMVCNCIRCREVKMNKNAIKEMDTAKLFIRNYEASGGMEYFISIESSDNKYIYGFCRLRLSKEIGYVIDKEPSIRNPKSKEEKVNLFSFLNGNAMIRELHVYGKMTSIVNETTLNVQHRGYGKMLVAQAEKIAKENGYNKIAIISGVGVRQYYEKLGYKLHNNYMIKDIKLNFTWIEIGIICLVSYSMIMLVIIMMMIK
jgi:ELP3 family radical SAM enzyme/protein acetyltransferase